MDAGDSTTPLAKKLGVKEGSRLQLVHASLHWNVDDLPANVSVTRRTSGSRADVVIAFFTRMAALRIELVDLSRLITDDGSLWLAWPRRAGGHVSDITDNLVREVALPLGLVDVKVAALDHHWSGLKFMWRKELRPGKVSRSV
jgi:hypothetical protein